MTLSLKKAVHDFFNGFKGNETGSKFANGKERKVLSTERRPAAKAVLFVDDEPSILMMRRLVFESLSYSVLTAISGEEALEALERSEVGMVVLDYLMPGMDGEETARRIRKLRGDIPIILSTGCLTLPERVRDLVTIVLEKAARPEELIEVLERYNPLLDPTPNGNGRSLCLLITEH